MSASDHTHAASVIPIYRPGPRPMSVVFFASGGPGNLQTALDVEREYPDLLRVDAVVTDRPAIPALELAHRYQRTALIAPFAELQRRLVHDYPDLQEREIAYRQGRLELHDDVLARLQELEERRGFPFDLAVLAYRRIIEGPLLRYFDARMINQHPADLAELEDNARCFCGIGGHARALRRGKGGSRTTTIVVRGGVDTGEILVRGPWVPFTGDASDPHACDEHERQQKRLSDVPALTAALIGVARGQFALSRSEAHADGCAVVYYAGQALPYGGLCLSSARGSETHSEALSPC